MIKVKGCIHIHIKKGRITNIFSHLSNYPKNCVIHLKPDSLMTDEEFRKNHPNDQKELETRSKGKIYDLGDSYYESEVS